MTSFFTEEYSYSKQCVRDTNRPNRPGILSTRVSKFVTILFYTDAPKITICWIRVWRDQDLRVIYRGRRMNANLSRLKRHPFHFYGDPQSWFVSIYHTFLTRSAKSNPAVVFQVHIHALPWQHFQSSSRHLCFSKRIAAESCKPILVLQQKSIQFRTHVRKRDN